MYHVPPQRAPVSPDTEWIYLRVPGPAVALRTLISYYIAMIRGCLPAADITSGFNLQIGMPGLLQLFPLQNPLSGRAPQTFYRSSCVTLNKIGKNNTATQLRLALGKWKNWKKYLQAESSYLNTTLATYKG